MLRSHFDGSFLLRRFWAGPKSQFQFPENFNLLALTQKIKTIRRRRRREEEEEQ
jgi:hypothetical protein